MTDRVKGFTVTLEKDIRIDDVEVIMQAIRMIRGIADVEPSISTSEDYMNRQMVKHELREKFWNDMHLLQKDCPHNSVDEWKYYHIENKGNVNARVCLDCGKFMEYSG